MKHGSGNEIMNALLPLFRPRLSLLNGVTAVTGYLLFPGAHRFGQSLAAFLGVALLAMGGSAINQVLERDIDALMIRTMHRPLPQGRLTPATAIFSGVFVILAGLGVIALAGGFRPALAGVVALLWYLGVYTPLKRKTTLAVPLGALCGAFPPLIGWSLAGGASADYRIVILSGLLFIWQIPHFWLLQERHEEDYRRADIPLATAGLLGRGRLLGLWLAAFVTAVLLLPALAIVTRPAALWLVIFSLLLPALMCSRSSLLACLNFFPLLLTLALLF